MKGSNKQQSFSRTSGSAPHSDKSATRGTEGGASKHGMKRSTGQKGNKYTADSTPGVG